MQHLTETVTMARMAINKSENRAVLSNIIDYISSNDAFLAGSLNVGICHTYTQCG